jgi:hypothetical protein
MSALKVFRDVSRFIIAKTIFFFGYRLILFYFLSGCFFCLDFRSYFRDFFSVFAFLFYFFK